MTKEKVIKYLSVGMRYFIVDFIYFYFVDIIFLVFFNFQYNPLKVWLYRGGFARFSNTRFSLDSIEDTCILLFKKKYIIIIIISIS